MKKGKVVMACNKDHSAVQSIMSTLPIDQVGVGRHKCAACAYEQGFRDGKEHKESSDLASILEDLEESQAMAQRHKSPHAAYALGYYDGIRKSYEK